MEAHQDPDLIEEESCATTIANNEMDTLQIEPTNIAETNMHQLNEYCLVEIFSCNSLTPMDLCSLAETCKRFKQIVQRVFPEKFMIYYDLVRKKQTFQSEDFNPIYSVDVDVDDCDRILRNFGSRLVRYDVCDDEVIKLVAKYCDGVALELLTIDDNESFRKVAAKLKSIIERVQKLTIRYDIVESDEIIKCDSLVELRLSYSKCFLSNNTFPNLRRFEVFIRFQKADVLFAFMSRHKLNYLKLHGILFQSDLVYRIDESCKELKELSIDCKCRAWDDVSENLSKLQNLTKLEILRINFSGELLLSLLPELKSLKTLDLESKWGKQNNPARVFDILSQLPNFRKLSVSGYQGGYRYSTDWSMIPKLTKLRLTCVGPEFCAADLLNIIKQLPVLEVMTVGFTSKLVLSEKDFLAIVETVQDRAHVLTLKCQFNFDYVKCKENQNVKLWGTKAIA